MKRTALILALVAAPVAAQDMPGAVDLGALSRDQVQRGTMDGHADRDTARRAPRQRGAELSASARAYCDAFPAYKRRFGANDPRVIRLATACRRAGYAY